MSKAAEPFVQVPFRVHRALEAGKLTKTQYDLLHWLIYRCRRDGGATTFTIAQLKSEARITVGGQAIIDALREIGAAGWIELGGGGQGVARWSASITGANLQVSASTDLEVTSNSLKSDEPANPRYDDVPAFLQPPSLGTPAEQSRAEEETASAEDIRAAALQSLHEAGGSLEHEVGRLLSHLRGVDDKSRAVVLRHARQVPLAVVVSLRERAAENPRGFGVGWAVAAMKDEAGTRPPNTCRNTDFDRLLLAEDTAGRARLQACGCQRCLQALELVPEAA